MSKFQKEKRLNELTEKIYRIANTQGYDDAFDIIKNELIEFEKDILPPEEPDPDAYKRDEEDKTYVAGC